MTLQAPDDPIPACVRAGAARLTRATTATGDAGRVPLDFTAIDFETANASSASACAVGLVRVRDSRVVDRAGWLIRPPAGHDRFFDVNVSIHGIHPEDVADAKGWSEQLADLTAFCGDDVLVAHNAGFDMAVIRRACEVTGDRCPTPRYFCTLQLARRAYDLPSHRLPVVADAVGFGDFAHHDATADASACAAIAIDAARRSDSRDLDALAAAHGLQLRVLASHSRLAEPRFSAA